MVSFGHTATGTIVGLAVYNLIPSHSVEGLLLATGAGIVSHYIFDLVPHGHWFRHKDYKKKIFNVIILDLLLFFLVFVGIAYHRFGLNIELLYILFGIGGAQLPDILDGFIYIGVIKKKGFFKIENNFHQATHWHGALNKSLIWGKRDIWQVIVLVLALLLVWKG